jgi:tetratricopeptide (TPR) repeat protein
MREILIMRLFGCLLAALLPCFLPVAAFAADENGLLRDGVSAYESGDFVRAARAFESVAGSGVINGGLFYNIGNAHLKAGDTGRAILWYERAARLLPGDPDLEFNLKHARGLAKDRSDGGPNMVARIVFFWRYIMSARAVRLCAVLFGAAFWIALAAWRMTSRRELRAAAVASGAIGLIFLFTALYNYYDSASGGTAVILPDEVIVRSGVSDDSTEMFRLHSGAIVRVVDRQAGHSKVMFSRDRIGWMRSSDVEEIRMEGMD